MMTIDIGWIDLAMLGLLVLSVLVGLVRGVVFELMSLAGWFVAWFAAIALEPLVLPHVHLAGEGSPLNAIAVVALVFVGVRIGWGLLARWLRSLVRATPLSLVDRVLGAGFGGVRAVLLLTLAVALVGVTPWSRTVEWQRSQGVVWARAAAREIAPFLPFRLIPSSEGETYVRHRGRDLEEPRQPVDL